MLGAVHLHADANHQDGEFAILVRSDLKGHGLGWTLMQLILEYARAERLRAVTGQVLRENRMMVTMCKELGFEITPLAEVDGIYSVRLPLAQLRGHSSAVRPVNPA
jgi:acetyltransferase